MPRPYSPRSSSGFSMLELLVGMTVAFVVMSAALGVALSARDLFRSDQARAGLNQDLRSAKQLLVTDLRQAGERLRRAEWRQSARWSLSGRDARHGGDARQGVVS